MRECKQDANRSQTKVRELQPGRPPMLYSVNGLLGYTIAATDGEVGKLEQLFFDDSAWIVRYLVVSMAGPTSKRKRVLLSPLAVENINPDRCSIHISLECERVHESPDIETEVTVSRQMEKRYFDYYHWPYYWSDAGIWGAAPNSEGAFGGPYEATAVPQESTEPATHLRSTKEVLGYRAATLNGYAGHVRDLIIDVGNETNAKTAAHENWSIRYLVVDYRERLRQRSTLLPPDQVESIDWHQHSFQLGVFREDIRRAPLFGDADSITPSFEQVIQQHYSRKAA